MEYCEDSYDAASGADALVIVTEWNQFRSLDMERIKSALNGNVIVDLRNVCSPERMADNGFEYFGVGRAATGSARVDSDELKIRVPRPFSMKPANRPRDPDTGETNMTYRITMSLLIAASLGIVGACTAEHHEDESVQTQAQIEAAIQSRQPRRASPPPARSWRP